MNEFLMAILQVLIGAGLAAVAGYGFARANPKKAALWLSKLAVKATFGNTSAADKIEDAMGDWLIELGKELKQVHPDDNEGDTNF